MLGAQLLLVNSVDNDGVQPSLQETVARACLQPLMCRRKKQQAHSKGSDICISVTLHYCDMILICGGQNTRRPLK